MNETITISPKVTSSNLQDVPQGVRVFLGLDVDPDLALGPEGQLLGHELQQRRGVDVSGEQRPLQGFLGVGVVTGGNCGHCKKTQRSKTHQRNVYWDRGKQRDIFGTHAFDKR